MVEETICKIYYYFNPKTKRGYIHVGDSNRIFRVKSYYSQYMFQFRLEEGSTYYNENRWKLPGGDDEAESMRVYMYLDEQRLPPEEWELVFCDRVRQKAIELSSTIIAKELR